jgi:hypothetical protein
MCAAIHSTDHSGRIAIDWDVDDWGRQRVPTSPGRYSADQGLEAAGWTLARPLMSPPFPEGDRQLEVLKRAYIFAWRPQGVSNPCFVLKGSFRGFW